MSIFKETRYWTIPCDWEIVPLKYLCKQSALYGFNEQADSYSETGVRFLRTTDIAEEGTLNNDPVYLPEEKVKGYLLSKGDILISRSGTVGRCYVHGASIGDYSYAGYLVRFVLKEDSYPWYLFYLTKTTAFKEWLFESSIESTIGNVNGEKYANLPVPVPPLSIQTKISNYLNRKTVELDQLIGAKQRLLKLLDEKKRTLIARAVTRGLNPDVPLKDSGIPWFGMIPAHWKKTIVKRLFTFAKRQGYPDLEVLSVYREYGVIIKSSRNDNNNRTPEDLTKYQLVEPGDLVINKMKAWQGSMGISKYTGITSPDYVVYEKNHNEDGEFLHYLFRAPFMPNVYQMFSNGIRLSQWRLEPEHFENLILFLPPVEEQGAIFAVVKKQLGKLDALKSITEKTIILLQERRTALISAAVTGKLSEEILNADIGTQTDESVATKSEEHNLCLT